MIWKGKKVLSISIRNRSLRSCQLLVLGLIFTTLVATAAGGSLQSSVGLDKTATPGSGMRAFIGPDGKTLPMKTDEEIESFLLTAEVVKLEELSIGVAGARRAYLEKDGIKARACFRDVDIHKRQEVLRNRGVRRNWRDCCLFECAAYELGKLLGMNNIPPVVMRKIKGTKGTLQIWVENALMENDRSKQKIGAPNPWRFGMQWQLKDLFDALIHNDDRNGGNFLYDQDWNLWLIDHTRCFPRISDLPESMRVKHCEKSIWNKLQSLDEEMVMERLEPYLESAELKALFKRREKLITYIEELIEERGEKRVLFSFY